MRFAQTLRFLISLAAWLFATACLATPPCRVAFDMGSSGIRAAASNRTPTPGSDIDALKLLWSDNGLDELAEITARALRTLPEQGEFEPGCPRVGGGFSVWRLALAQDAEKLAVLLARIREQSDVAILILPAEREGVYGYFAARQKLGTHLTSSHILDIGGGSLQIAGEDSAFVAPLGQKAWHRRLCQSLRNTAMTPCRLQPMNDDELIRARAQLAEELHGMATALPAAITLTAISRPVSRGVLPAVRRLVGDSGNTLLLTALSTAIRRLAPLALEASRAETGSTAPHDAYLLSDLLLVEGLLRGAGQESLTVTETALTNLPGLLADDHAFRWQREYDCYLARLRSDGLKAYASDPASCSER